MAEPEKNCYIGINGKKYGPVSEEDIKKLYALKKINGDTNFARVGATEWITVSKSGIITPAVPTSTANDGLPPLPQVDKPAETKGSAKKSKLWFIAAGLAVVVVISVAVSIGLIASMGKSPAIPANNDIAQNNNAEKPSDTPAKEETANASIISDESLPANNGALEYLTFRVPQFGVEFDYPSNFVIKKTPKSDIEGVSYVVIEYPEKDGYFMSFLFESVKYMESLADLADSAGKDTVEFRSNFKSLDVDKAIASRKSLIEEEDGTFELLGSSKSTNSYLYYYKFNTKFNGRLISQLAYNYNNYGDFSDAYGTFRINANFNIPLEYADNYDDFFQTFQAVTGSIRRIDYRWKEAEALIPSQYKEGSLEYQPAYNIEDDDGGVLFYGFYFYAKDTYGEILVNPVTGEVEVDSRETPSDDEFAEPGESISNNIVAENATPPETADNGIVGEWEMQEDGANYRLTLGADGTFNEDMRFIYGAGGWTHGHQYEVISEDTIRITELQRYGILEDGSWPDPIIYDVKYRLEGEVLYFNDHATPYHRYIEPIDPNVLLNEKYEGTPLSPSYESNSYIAKIIFNEARAYILDGDDYILTRDPNGWTYAKSRYDVAVTMLEQQGYKDTPLHKLALSRWIDAYYKEAR